MHALESRQKAVFCCSACNCCWNRLPCGCVLLFTGEVVENQNRKVALDPYQAPFPYRSCELLSVLSAFFVVHSLCVGMRASQALLGTLWGLAFGLSELFGKRTDWPLTACKTDFL